MKDTLIEQFISFVLGEGEIDEFVDTIVQEATGESVSEEVILFNLLKDATDILYSSIGDVLDEVLERREEESVTYHVSD